METLNLLNEPVETEIIMVKYFWRLIGENGDHLKTLGVSRYLGNYIFSARQLGEVKYGI